MTAYRALGLFSASQVARGLVLIALGVVALQWPDAGLPRAMAGAAVFVVLSGTFDVAIGIAARRDFRGWPILAAHGAACIVFGLLTAVFTRLPQQVTMRLVAAWLLLYGLATGALALAFWPMRRTRWTLISIAMVLVPVGMVASTLGDMPQHVPLYFGACFVVFLGSVHLAGGLWLRWVAMPQYAPTTQAGWAPPAGAVQSPANRAG